MASETKIKNNAADTPDLSIVILTYNKQFELALILASLCKQDYPMEKVEVVIVDDGSGFGGDGVGGNNQATVDFFSDRLNIHYFPLEHTGNRAKNRIYGADQSVGRCILFLDSDMVPARDSVRRHMEIADVDKPTLSNGYRWRLLEFDRRMVRPEAIELVMDIFRAYPAYSDERDLLWLRNDPSLITEAPWLQVYSHNLCVRRSLYKKVGGFNAAFGDNWGVEDIELGYRLYQAGCKIVCDRNIFFYHINHYENMRDKFQQLGGNLSLFLKLHPAWEVELFRYEYRIWAAEYLKLCARIRKGEHLVHKVSNASGLPGGLEGRVISIGITDENIISHPSVSCVVSTEKVSVNSEQFPFVGTVLDFEDGTFDCALVSAAYSGFGFNDIVLGEAGRIAKKVIIVDGQGKSIPHPDLSRRKVIISVSTMNDEISSDHINLLNLAWFLSKRGVDVSLRNNLDEYLPPDLSLKFYHIGDSKKRATLKSLYNGSHDFDPSIPNISHERYLCDRSYGANFLWYDFISENEEQDFIDEYLSQYDYFLYRNADSWKKCGSPASASFLPCGVDAVKLSMYPARKPAADGILKFVWFCEWFYSGCGFDTLVSSFLQVFGGRKDVTLDLHFAETTPIRNYLSFNNTYNSYINLCNNSVTLEARAYFNDTLAAVADSPQISMTFGNSDDETIQKIMAGADCLIDTRPSRDATALVLDALGMGKKVIRCGNDAYSWYCDDAMFINIDYEKTSPLNFRANPEGIWYGTSYQSKTRHQLMHRMKGESLSVAFREVDNHRELLKADENSVAQFRQRHDWNNVVERLLKIL